MSEPDSMQYVRRGVPHPEAGTRGIGEIYELICPECQGFDGHRVGCVYKPAVWCSYVFGSGDTCVEPFDHQGPHSKGPHGNPD